ncbi:MAG: hypothetical protein ACNA8R_14610 [Nitriliruptoraceae bacterium]
MTTARPGHHADRHPDLIDLDLPNRGGVHAHGDGGTAVTPDDHDDVAGCPEDVEILAERWVRPGVSMAISVDADAHHVNGPWDPITGRQSVRHGRGHGAKPRQHPSP